MPIELEKKLEAEALQRFGSKTSPKARAYIYGTMRRTGWRPGKELAKNELPKRKKEIPEPRRNG